MDEKIIQDILTDVFSSLEPLDAHCSAILQFLKAKGFATDKELAPFLEQAENASNVRWLAARVRIASLLSSALKPPEQPAEAPAAKAKQAPEQPAENRKKETDEESEGSFKEEGTAEPESVQNQSEKESKTTKLEDAVKEEAA
jgi:flagellar biosynthesis/type III secretory pathway M-ring protein FliF/YscJ